MKKSVKITVILSVIITVALCMSFVSGCSFKLSSELKRCETEAAEGVIVSFEAKTARGEWEAVEGKALSVKKSSVVPEGAVASYELPVLRVKNGGENPVKYSLKINGVNGDEKLASALTWSVNDADVATVNEILDGGETSVELIVKATLKDTTNDYSGLSIESAGVTLTVEASEYSRADESISGVVIGGIAGVADRYDDANAAYLAVKAMLEEKAGLAEQPMNEETFNAFFTEGGKITWKIYGKQKVTDTRMFSFGRAANRFGETLHITEIDIVGGNSKAALDLSEVEGTFALPYNWWNVENSVNTALKCKNVAFDGITGMPSGTYQCTLHSTVYEFDGCTFNGKVYSYQNFDVVMTIKNCVFNAPEKTQYAFMSQGLGGVITLTNNVFNGYTRGVNFQRATADFVFENNTIKSDCVEADRAAIQLTDGKSFAINGNKIDITSGNAFWFHNAATNADVTYVIKDNDIKATYIGYSGVTAFDVNAKITSSGNKFNDTDVTKCMKKGATVAEATNLTAIR
ncbi:MAG: NosD domain-containing protein [Candidatus Borkfalkiaceae bacterium]|nr:NosD domain-containing protein [Christensenellaceae bacterium]